MMLLQISRKRRDIVLRTLTRTARRLEEHWIGDMIGAACLFGTGYLLFFAAGVLA